MEPKTSLFSPTQITIKDLAWKDFIRREWRNKDGHPDYVYTKEKMNELEVKEEVSKANAPLKSIPSEIPVTCPQCSSERLMTRAFGVQYNAFECLECGFKWKRFHGTFAQKPKRKKRISIKKMAILLTSIFILIVIVLNGPIIYLAFQDFMQQPSHTKVNVVLGQIAEVEFDGNKYLFVYEPVYILVITPLSHHAYYEAVEGAVYSSFGLEIVVSEVYPDRIVLLVKPYY